MAIVSSLLMAEFCSIFEIDWAKPKKVQEKIVPIGWAAPKLAAAMAIKPRPLVMFWAETA